MISQELETSLKKGNYSRAAYLAGSLGLDKGTVKAYQQKALWQMAAVYRNIPGTKRLAEEFGFTREELEQILRQRFEQAQGTEEARELEPCYDQESGDYLTFEQWLERLLRNWKKIQTQ